MIYDWTRYKKYALIILAILLVICGIVYKNTVYDAQAVLIEQDEQVEQPIAIKEESEKIIEEEPNITIYVCGSVKTPMNVTLPKDSRIADAIIQAGGAAENADLNGINMAQKLNDEDMVYVPQKGEIITSGGKDVNITSSPAKKGKLNINKANVEQLDSLPGVGPAIAQRIIEYRDSSGGFKSIEELNNVSGIGNEKYKDIKALITVD